MEKFAVEVKNIYKTFRLPHERHSGLKQKLLSLGSNVRGFEKQHVLEDISFNVKKGEFFGIVGRNGSGKSTLLKILASIYVPDRGKVTLHGSLTPFIELGVGFNPELTGRENVYLNGALLGFSRKEVEGIYDEIVEFAELERFMDQKLKNYSSGMQVRLAFSIAIQAKSDILLLDEVLAVGDTIFQQKCFRYFDQLKQNRQTVLLVSHDASALRRYCDRGVLIEAGKIVSMGDIDEVLNDYTDIVSQKEAANLESEEKKQEHKTQTGTGKVKLKGVKVLNRAGEKKTVVGDADDEIIIEAEFQSNDDVKYPIYGVVIKNTAGVKLFAANNAWKFQESHSLSTGDIQKVVWHIPNIFNTGEYSLTIAVADSHGREVYDQIEKVETFKVRKKTPNSSLTNPAYEIDLPTPRSGSK